MVEISQPCIAEFDGTGNPTGNIWVNGKKYTGCTATHVGTISATDFKSTTKITLAVNCHTESTDATKFYTWSGDNRTVTSNTGSWTAA
jgi:hypothetical protein